MNGQNICWHFQNITKSSNICTQSSRRFDADGRILNRYFRHICWSLNAVHVFYGTFRYVCEACWRDPCTVRAVLLPSPRKYCWYVIVCVLHRPRTVAKVYRVEHVAGRVVGPGKMKVYIYKIVLSWDKSYRFDLLELRTLIPIGWFFAVSAGTLNSHRPPKQLERVNAPDWVTRNASDQSHEFQSYVAGHWRDFQFPYPYALTVKGVKVNIVIF